MILSTWFLKFTLLLFCLWAVYLALGGQNPRWRVWLWRAGSVAAVMLMLMIPLGGLFRIELPVLSPNPSSQHVASADAAVDTASPFLRESTQPKLTTNATTGNAEPLRAAEHRPPVEPLTAESHPVHSSVGTGSGARGRHPATAADPIRGPAVSSAISQAADQQVAGASFDPRRQTSAPERSGWRVGMFRVGLLGVWLLGVVYAVVRWLVGELRLRRILTRSVPAREPTLEMMRALAERLGVPPVQVRVSETVRSPSIVGLLRPTILLPLGIEDPDCEDDLRAALAHELGHVAGDDLVWDRGVSLIAVLAWCHPLAWPIRAAHRGGCERVCDIVASDLLRDRGAYKSSLANMALRVAGETPAVGLAMMRPDIVRRLRALSDTASANPLGRRTLAGGIGVGMLVVTLASVSVSLTAATAIADGTARDGDAAQQTASADDAVNPSDNAAPDPAGSENSDETVNATDQTDDPVLRTVETVAAFRLKVLAAEDQEPIAGANVQVRLSGKDLRVRETRQTDAEGAFLYTYPSVPDAARMTVTVRAAGYVPYQVDYGSDLTESTVPSEKVIRLRTGAKVGGVVVDESGNPIAGAELRLHIPVTETDSRNYVFSLLEDPKTDEQGRWFLDGAPEPVSTLRIGIDHPEFLRTNFLVKPELDAEYALQRGWTIRGTVRDQTGAPVADAIVHPGDDRWGSGKPEAKTAEDGTYELVGLELKDTRLTVTAAHLTPKSVPVSYTSNPATVDFELEKGHTVRFLVVDREDRPVNGVRFIADSWNGLRTLEWSGRSDENGELSWDGAPAEPVQFDILGGGFATKRNYSAVARDELHRIVLHAPTNIIASVTDAGDDSPVPQFTAQIGWRQPGRNEITWHYRKSRGHNGTLDWTYSENQEKLYLRIEADGFTPWVSDEFSIAPRVDFDVAMQRGTGITGVVVTPDGAPATGARVILVTEDEGMQFTGGFQTDGGAQQVNAADDGTFRLRPLADPETPGLIVIVHNSGYKEVSLYEFSETNRITLDEWARVELSVFDGERPLPQASVTIQPSYRSGVSVFSYAMNGKTNDAGSIVFEKVVPLKCWIGQTLVQPIGSGTSVYPSRGQTHELKPGETKRVTIGGEGTHVSGSVRLPPDPPGPHEWTMNQAGALVRSDVERSDPAYVRYQFLFDDQGRFRVPDVPAGTYKLSISLTERPDPNFCGTGRRIGLVPETQIEVSEEQTELSIGEVDAEWLNFIGPGDVAPEFVATDSNGGRVRLSDLRGKLVLLDFWATWCSPCIAEMPALKKLQEQFVDDPRFQLVGVSLDSDFESASHMMQQRGWNWMMLNGGPNVMAPIPDRFDVESLPQKFLIDPQGQIIARTGKLEDLPELIEKTLTALPAEVEPTSRPVGFQPIQIEDDFRGRVAADVAVALTNPHFPAGVDPVPNPPAGLSLLNRQSGTIRDLSRLAPDGWLIRPDRIANDANRKRLFVVADQHLEAIGYNGVRQYRVALPRPQSIAVDDKTGDLWCILSGSLSTGETVILDSDGKEKDRLPVHGFTLRYSAAADAFWFVGKQAKLVTREGEIVCAFDLPSEAYTFAAVSVDRDGGCFALEDDHPDVPGSRNRLWHFDARGGSKQLVTFPRNIRDSDEYVRTRWLEAIGDDVWVGLQHAVGLNGRQRNDRWFIRRYDRDGKQLAEFDHDHLAAASDSAKESLWIFGDGEIVRLDRAGNRIEAIPSHRRLRGAYQSAWLISLD